MKYQIAWGHSGTQGRHWSTAREAAEYAADTWGEVEADTPEAAVEIVRQEAPEGMVGGWWFDGDKTIHIVGTTSLDARAPEDEGRQAG